MKKTMVTKVLALALCALMLCSCGTSAAVGKDGQVQEGKGSGDQSGLTGQYSGISAQYMDGSFKDVLDLCTDIVTGVRTGDKETLSFTVAEVLAGESLAQSDIVTVTGTVDEDAFVEGEAYLLPLGRHVSVFFAEDRYVLEGGAVIPLSNLKDAVALGKPLFEGVPVSQEAFVSDLRSYPLVRTFYGVPYTAEETMEGILAFAPYVLKVRIGKAADVPASSDRIVYEAAVLNSYKGVVPSETVWVVLPTAGIGKTTGEEWIIAGSFQAEGTPALFVPSSLSGIFAADSETRIANLLAEAR